MRPEIAGGGLFFDLASHTLDLLDHLLGPIADAAGRASNQGGLYDAEDTVTARLGFASGVHGAASWCFVAGTRVDRVELAGTRGRITFAVYDDAPVTVETADGTEELRVPHPPHVQQPLVQLVVDELRGRGQSPSTGESAARTAAVMERIVAG